MNYVVSDVRRKDNCPFCLKIERGEYNESSRHAVVFEPLNPVVRGHLLVVSRLHIPHAAKDPVMTGQVMEMAARVAYEMIEANIIVNIGQAATQTIFHLHIHVIPRRPGDGIKLPWSH